MTDVQAPPTTVSVSIDGRQLDVPKGTLVIRAAEQLGITIPRFCDHPLLNPVGACRQCMVEVEGQKKPFTSCTTTCTEGMVVKTHLSSEVAKHAQEGVLELLLVNHPLDCPQCDKGGECPLQDQVLAHGAPDSRYIDDKRRYDKSIPISAQILLDREKCVLCARCTRFSQEISGDPFIELFERGALQQVAIYEDEPYQSYYSGNIVQICPVGALTSTSYRFSSRPFDLRSEPSVCNQCANGCNLRVDIRANAIQRQLARDNVAVNESWSCDKGRYGYAFVDSPQRLRDPLVRDELGTPRPAAWVSAMRRTGRALKGAIDAGGPASVGILAGARLTDEDLYAVSRFARDVVGTDNIDFRLSPRTVEERDVLSAVAGTVGPTYDDVEQAPVVVIAGLDTEQEAPILHLRLRKAWRKHRQRIVVVGPVLGSLAEIVWRWVPTGVGGEAAALAALGGGGTGGDVEHGEEVATALREASSGAVVLAGERLAASPGALHGAVALATDVGGRFAWIPRRTNARGAVDAGLVPGLLPGGRPLAQPGPLAELWNRVPDAEGMDTHGMLEAAADGRITVLYLIGIDPARDFEDPALAERALERVGTLIVQDLLPTASTRNADVILPAAAPQERAGSFTTWEGRRQPFPQALLQPQGQVLQDWDILRQVARVMGVDLGWETAFDVRREAASVMDGAAGGSESESAAHASRSAPPLGAGPLEGETPPSPMGGADPAAEATDGFDVVCLPYLLGLGSMLSGAEALGRTARPAEVWVAGADAARLGLSSGQMVTVVGNGARLELPVCVTAGVVAGVVVVPANSTQVPGAVVGTRVTLEVVAQPVAEVA